MCEHKLLIKSQLLYQLSCACWWLESGSRTQTAACLAGVILAEAAEAWPARGESIRTKSANRIATDHSSIVSACFFLSVQPLRQGSRLLGRLAGLFLDRAALADGA